MTIGQLMKNLRDKGWIPRGYNEVIHTVYDKKYKMIGLYEEGEKYLELVYKKSLRGLCSKESGLWQFVCENEMVDLKDRERKHYNEDNLRDKVSFDDNYQYWVIESALCDEDKLEQFLLDNIKIYE